ncbi:hypothetical protein OQA88_2740 [Cercophora sp. LCS_1]
MSAPSIPNLLTLRGGARRGRGRGGTARGGHAPGTTAGARHDLTIQGTDNDAAQSRLSAVQLGYLQDPFAQLFSPPAPRRQPIINRGTYIRTTAITKIVTHFLQSTANQPKRKQIISLGAGTDTRALHLLTAHNDEPIVYHEIDFPTICRRKEHLFRNSPEIARCFEIEQPLPSNSNSPVDPTGPPPVGAPDTTVTWRARDRRHKPNTIHCHGLDLRTLTPQSELLPGVDPTVPTLLISECCLCYLSPPEASNVLAHFSTRIQNIGIVIYEPIKPGDPFGQMMVSNLAARGIRMPTLEVYKQPEDQEERLRAAGFREVRQMTVDRIWDKWVDEDEKERVEGLEWLDEVEEWKLLSGHYIVAWGWTGAGLELPDRA